MSLTSAMLVGFTGIKSNTVAVDTIGDNVANVNTTAFKTQRALFETVLYRTLRGGEAPVDPLVLPAFGPVNRPHPPPVREVPMPRDRPGRIKLKPETWPKGNRRGRSAVR